MPLISPVCEWSHILTSDRAISKYSGAVVLFEDDEIRSELIFYS
jgi:hypothetical protein